MGCKYINSREEEYEIDKNYLKTDSENIFNQNDLNNTNGNKYLNHEINENNEKKRRLKFNKSNGRLSKEKLYILFCPWIPAFLW